MDSISINYTLKWQIKFATYYKWTECKRLFNCKTGREIKKTLNGGSIGYWIKGKFITLTNLAKEVELIHKQEIPF